jgi:hypothetical protein
VVDMWLPVIKKLKENYKITIDLVFPESSSLRLEDKDSDLFNITKFFTDRVIYRGYSERWFIANNLIEASNGIKFNYIDNKILQLSSRLENGRASKVYVLKKMEYFWRNDPLHYYPTTGEYFFNKNILPIIVGHE